MYTVYLYHSVNPLVEYGSPTSYATDAEAVAFINTQTDPPVVYAAVYYGRKLYQTSTYTNGQWITIGAD